VVVILAHIIGAHSVPTPYDGTAVPTPGKPNRLDIIPPPRRTQSSAPNQLSANTKVFDTEKEDRLMRSCSQVAKPSMIAVDTASIVWYCDIGEIASLQSPEWDAYLGFLTAVERERVLKYRFDDDRRRALISAMLQRWLVRSKLGLEKDTGFDILRTPENKPYAFCGNNPDGGDTPLSFWNYNLSHHGRYVGLASHATRLVGVDIVDISTRTSMVNTAHAYAMLFKGQLHPEELQAILAQSSELRAYALFFVIWSLKESFIKAVGLGLGYDLQTVRFSVYYAEGSIPMSPGSPHGLDSGDASSQAIAGYATVRIDGSERAMYRGGAYRNAEEIGVCARNGAWDISTAPPVPPSSAEVWSEKGHSGLWTFDFFSLDARHVISVAQGPLSDSLRSYKLLAWNGKEIPADLIPPSGNHRTALDGSADASTETDTNNDARAVAPPKPPSPTGVSDAGTLSSDNAAILAAESFETPSFVLFNTITPPRAIQMSVHSLLPPAMLEIVPPPQPMSPPATDLNNRYDLSILHSDGGDVGAAADPGKGGSNGAMECVSPSPTAGTTSGGMQYPVYKASVEMPLSPSARPKVFQQSPPGSNSASPLSKADLATSANVDWKTLPLPSRDVAVGSDFNSPAGWRTQMDKPSSAEIDRIGRQCVREVSCGDSEGQSEGGMTTDEGNRTPPLPSPGSGSGAGAGSGAACVSMCTIM